MRSVPFVESPKRLARSATKPVARVGVPLNNRVVWTLCAVALVSVGMVAWKVQETARETVVLSPQSQALPQGASTPSMAQFPGLASPHSEIATAPLMTAPATIASQPPEQAAELSRARAESAAVTASVSSVPISTWPVVTQTSNGVPPRSDMRYQVNAPPRR